MHTVIFIGTGDLGAWPTPRDLSWLRILGLREEWVMKQLLSGVLALAFAGSADAGEMTFTLAGTGGNCNGCEWVAAEGEITGDTPQRFCEFIATHDPHLIILNSPGGSLAGGIELGRLIRETGATTAVGDTRSLTGDLADYEETIPGVCVSACAFAFMGGVERWIDPEDRLGVHQFYSVSGDDLDSETTQQLVGYTLMYVLQMGIDPALVVASSGTSPDEIYWFSHSEIKELNLDTSGTTSEPWRLEPYGGGVVLTTTYHEGARRSVHMTVFCRQSTRQWHVLITEDSAHWADHFRGKEFIGPDARYQHRPTINLAGRPYVIRKSDIDFFRVAEDRFYLSMMVPTDLTWHASQDIAFDPDLASVHWPLLSARGKLPEADWLRVAERMCI